MYTSSCRALSAFLWLVLCGVLASCGGGGSSTTTGPTGSISGLVVSSTTGTGLAGVTVTAGGKSATTSNTGSYTLSGVGVNSAVVVTFALDGYAPGYQSVGVTANATARAGTRLTTVGVSSTLDAASGGTVTTPTGPAQVVLPGGGLVNKATGAAATGPVTVGVTPINPAADAANMPGNYSARGTDNGAQTIESFGAVSINLSDASGNRLDLASGQTATIRIPVATRSTDPLPATIPLYYFDETAGLWVEQGSATLAGTAPSLYYEGTVSHFTYWNADRATETIYVHGCVNRANASPSPDATVSTDGIDYTGSSSGLTDANGNFTVPIRKGGTANLYADSPDGTSNVIVVGPSQVDITLPACLVLGPPGPPVIVTQPMSKSAQEGQLVPFSVVARGTQPLRYQWQRNGTPIADATISLYYLYPVSGADNGAQYTVVVSNDYGSVTSDVATLHVAVSPPGLLSGPASTSVTVGASATFSVVTSQPPSLLTFQWRRNGTAIAGATGSSYTTPPATLGNDGDRYSVTLTNTAGTVTSPDAVLSVQALTAPSITQQPASTSVATGQSAIFQVQASGSGPLSYQWKKGGTAIGGATGTSYTTPATTLADNGAVYTVVVTNTAGSVTSTPATLSVVDPTTLPSITQQPQGVTKVTGQTATFSVTATGTAPLSYQWLRGGSAITGATAASYTTPALTLADNAASFTVRVTNPGGSVTSSAAVLTVTAGPTAPVIATQPQNASVVAGLTATFSVAATGTSPLSYQWRRNGTDVNGATGSSYTTPTLQVADSGAVYAVVVTNPVGSVTSANATLTVTPSQTGAGRYLVAQAGPTVTTAIVYANGSQSVDSKAVLAATAASPTTTSVVEPAGQATTLFGQVYAGSVGGGQVSDLHTRYALYFKGTRLYKVDHQATGGAPAGVPLSTLAPSGVCSSSSEPILANLAGDDLGDASRNWRFFATPVAGACPSIDVNTLSYVWDSYAAVRLSMSGSDAPVAVGEPVATLFDSSANITGYVLRSGATFSKVDAGLANPTTLFTLTPSAFKSYGVSFGASTPGIWMFLNAGQLYAYKLGTSASTPTVVATLQNGEQVGQIVTDGASAYVSLTGSGPSGGYRILRVADDLSASVVTTGTARLSEFALTPTRIVLVTSPDLVSFFNTSVSSLLRDGTGPLDVGGTGSGFYTVLIYTAAENVYLYEFAVNSQGIQSAVRTRIINSDGSNAQTLANTGIVGATQAASVPLVSTLGFTPYAVLLADNVSTDGSASGSTIRSVAAATRAALLTYGTLQATPAAALFPATIDPLQYGEPGLFSFQPTGGNAATSDLYFLDSDTAASLTKVTTFVTTASGRDSPAAAVRSPGSRKAGAASAARALQERLHRQRAAQR